MYEILSTWNVSVKTLTRVQYGSGRTGSTGFCHTCIKEHIWNWLHLSTIFGFNFIQSTWMSCFYLIKNVRAQHEILLVFWTSYFVFCRYHLVEYILSSVLEKLYYRSRRPHVCKFSPNIFCRRLTATPKSNAKTLGKSLHILRWYVASNLRHSWGKERLIRELCLENLSIKVCVLLVYTLDKTTLPGG